LCVRQKTGGCVKTAATSAGMTVSPVSTLIKEKKMRKSLYASVLVLALCGSVLAGDISNPPPPGDISNPPSAVRTPYDEPTDGQPDEGAEPSADDIIPGDEVDGLTAAALSVLNSVLALF
jgi:hypothetical protein